MRGGGSGYASGAILVEEFKEFRSSGVQEFRSSGVQEFRSSGVQEFRSSGVQRGVDDRIARKKRLLRPERRNRSKHFCSQLLNSCTP
jgi:hypothetical protein